MASQYAFDAQRFWLLEDDDTIIAEVMSVVYAPNDPRAIAIPSDLWDFHRGAVSGAIQSGEQIVGLDPDVNTPITEVINGWIVESRAINAGPNDDGHDPIFGDIEGRIDFFDMVPVDGVKQLTAKKYSSLIRKAEKEDVSVRKESAQEMATAHNSRFDAIAASTSEDVATAMLGGRITAEEILSAQNGGGL